MTVDPRDPADVRISPAEVLDRVAEAVVAVDTDWRVEYLSDRAADLLDVERSSAIGHDLRVAVPAIETSPVYGHLRTALATGSPSHAEIYASSHDQWYAVSARPSDTGVTVLIDPIDAPVQSHLETADGVNAFDPARDIPADRDSPDGLFDDDLYAPTTEQRPARTDVRVAALEATMDGIAILDRNEEYIYMNDAHAAVFEYDPEDLLGRTWRALYGDDEVDRIEQEVFPEVERIGRWRGETLGRTRSGAPAPQEITLSTLPDGKLICVNRDISDAKARAQDLEQYEALVESLELGTFILDEDHCIRFLNGWVSRSIGQPPSTIEGTRLEDLVARLGADDTSVLKLEGAIDDTLRAARGGSTTDSVDLSIELDAEVHVVEVQLTPITAADDAQLVVIVRDVTRERRREEHIQELKERLSLAVEGANLGVWDWDLETDTISYNDQWADMLGVAVDAIDHTSAWYRERVHPDDRPGVIDAIETHFDGDTDQYDVEHRMRTGDGGWRWVRDVGQVVERDADGSPMRAVGIQIDISERKRTQRALEDERDMFAAGPAVVFKWDAADGRPVEYVSENVSTVFGYTASELQSGTLDYVDIVHPEDRDRVVDATATARADGREQFTHEPYRIVTADDDAVWVSDTTKIVTEGGEAVRYLGYLVDITDQKRRENQLKTARSRFSRFADTVPGAFFLISPDQTEAHYINSSAETIYGVPRDELLIAPDRWMRHVHPDDIEDLRNEITQQRRLDAGWPRTQEFRVQHPDRGLRWIRSQVHPIRDGNGDVAEIAGLSTDITEQKQLEQSLRENEAWLRSLIEVASDADLVIEDKLNAILDLGREYLGLSYAVCTHVGDDGHQIRQSVGDHPQLRAGASPSDDDGWCHELTRKAGVTAVPAAGVHDSLGLGCYIGGPIQIEGEFAGMLCLAGETERSEGFTETERVFVGLLLYWLQYELASERVKTKLRGLNATAQRVMNAESVREIGTIVAKSARDTLGIPIAGIWWYETEQEEFVPGPMTPEAEQILDHRPTIDRENAIVHAAYETGRMQVEPGDCAIGELRDDVELACCAVVPLDDHGLLLVSTRGADGFSQTDRSLLEMLGATTREAFNRATRERALRDTRKQLKQSNQELQQFAYVASHDLQEPLRTISSYLTLLERRHGEALSGEADEFLEFAVNGADRMREMIKGLLAYSRVETRGSPLTSTDMVSVFAQVRQNLEVTISESDATIVFPPDPGIVAGDERQLVQLFQNLIENGIKYSEDAPIVTVECHRREETIEYTVSDEGIGMAREHQDGIFEVFERLHTREEYDGTGIGLSICRKIVERHGGRIGVNSIPDEGSVFTVELPAGDQTDG